MDFKKFSPCLLIAMPELKEPHFEKTVVLLTDYTPEGAIGFIINRPSDLVLGDSIVLSEGELNPDYAGYKLWTGGPVDQNKLWVIYDNAVYDNPQGILLSVEGATLAQDISILLDHEKTLGKNHIRVIHGYAGWGAKQLEAEIAASFWITAPLNKSIIFNPDPSRIWERAVEHLGIDANKLIGQQSNFLQ
jgi:putative transcriptional regulator